MRLERSITVLAAAVLVRMAACCASVQWTVLQKYRKFRPIGTPLFGRKYLKNIRY